MRTYLNRTIFLFWCSLQAQRAAEWSPITIKLEESCMHRKRKTMHLIFQCHRGACAVRTTRRNMAAIPCQPYQLTSLKLHIHVPLDRGLKSFFSAQGKGQDFVSEIFAN